MATVKEVAKKSTNFLGFNRGYNVICFIIFGGAMLGFSLAKIEDISVHGLICRIGGAAGECFYHKHHLYYIGILLHMIGVLPATFLAPFQFIPAIRRRAMILHRLNGYLVILLILLSNVGGLMVARRTMGGGLSVQIIVGILFIITTFSILNAYYNVKRLQLDQHRAWMLRTFAWQAVVITQRLIIMAMASALATRPATDAYYDVRGCDELIVIAGAESVYKHYPECIPGNSKSNLPDKIVMQAAINPKNPYEAVALGDITFPAALFLALAIHVVLMELYLSLTPREAQRLRQISYEKQLERGFKNPGSAGFVLDKYGDADRWTPSTTTTTTKKSGDNSAESPSSSSSTRNGSDSSVSLEKGVVNGKT